MDTATFVALAVALLALLGVGVLAVLFASQQRRHSAYVVAQRDEIDTLRAQLAVPPTPTQHTAPAAAEFLITDAGTASNHREAPVDERLVLSAAFGDSLVKVVALGHGLRRALSPRSLHRIRYEIRSEVRHSRRQRRRRMRQAWQRARSAERTSEGDQEPAA